VPSTATITAFYSFTAGGTIKSAEVNNNFSIFRGHLLPTDPNASTAATSNTYDLGASDHYWKTLHVKDVALYELSTGAHAVTLKSPDSITSSYNFIFPQNMGSANRVLRTDGTNTDWIVNGGSFGYTSVSAEYSMTSSDVMVYCNSSLASFTVTLPPVSSSTGTSLYFHKTGTDLNTVTLDPNSTDLLDETTASTTINTPGESLRVHNDGSGWRSITRKNETPWVAYTPTFAGIGTPANVAIFSRRVGDCLEIRGNFTCGTVTGTTVTMTIGFNGTNANVTLDTAKFASAHNTVIGEMVVNSSTSIFNYTIILVPANTGSVSFGAVNGSNNGFSAGTGSGILGTGLVFSIAPFSVPISGW
jgi:hypothetical protein